MQNGPWVTVRVTQGPLRRERFRRELERRLALDVAQPALRVQRTPAAGVAAIGGRSELREGGGGLLLPLRVHVAEEEVGAAPVHVVIHRAIEVVPQRGA